MENLDDHELVIGGGSATSQRGPGATPSARPLLSLRDQGSAWDVVPADEFSDRHSAGGVFLPPERTENLLGQSFGNYALEVVLGSGGMGTVYYGTHVVIGSHVAVKVLHRRYCQDEHIVRRFFAEARAVNLIGHENIIKIFDFSRTPEGRYYYVMEYLQGTSLAELLDSGPLALEAAAPILFQVMAALSAAHEHGVIHRDLKPANIFLIPVAGQQVVKILDFGVAKLQGEPVFQTQVGELLGTPHFMAPEQACADPVDARADVYSLGVILYRIATGRLPFDGQSVPKILLAQVGEPPVAPHSLNPEISPELEAVILTALAKEPRDRFSSIAAFHRALQTVVARQQARQAAPPSIPAAERQQAAPANAESSADPFPTLTPDPEPTAEPTEPPTPRQVAHGSFERAEFRPLAERRTGRPYTPAFQIQIKIADWGEFQRMYRSDISHQEMFIESEDELPPVFTIIEIALHPPGHATPFKLIGKIVRVVNSTATSSWKKRGIGVELLDLDEAKRLQLESMISGLPSPPGATDPAALSPNPIVRRLIDRLAPLLTRDHYDVLVIPRNADLHAVCTARRKLIQEMDPALLGPMSEPQAEALSQIRARIERAADILTHPKSRAEYDAEHRNYVGVAQSLVAGLQLTDLDDLRARYLAINKGAQHRARDHQREALAAEYAGRLGEARAAYERALMTDPLNAMLHQRYWMVRRRQANGTTPIFGTPTPVPCVGGGR